MVYKIQILAFKAPVGKYTIKLKLKDAEGEYNSSNALQFAITKTYYKVILVLMFLLNLLLHMEVILLRYMIKVDLILIIFIQLIILIKIQVYLV